MYFFSQVDGLTIDDYNHRWRYISKACKGIYWFCRILLYEVPKWVFITLPWELLKMGKSEMVRLYRSIPPVKEWPRIAADACVSTLRGIKNFMIELGKVIKATPKAVYNGGKYLVKKIWRGIKAIPDLVTTGALKAWNGIKAVATWLQDLISRLISLSSGLQ
jgi:hypothetical protein